MSDRSINLPRQVFACYVLFTLLGIVFFCVGLIFINQSHVEAKFENDLGLKASKAESEAVIAYVCDGNEGLQDVVQRLSAKESLNYCFVVSVDGTYLAHTAIELVGEIHEETIGERIHSPMFDEIRTENDGELLRELAVQLYQDKTRIGSLRLGLIDDQSQSWNQTWAFATRLPVLMIPSFLLLLIGGYVIQRLVRPVTDVHDQLRRAACHHSVHDANLETIPTNDAMSVGWNKLVEEFGETSNHMADSVTDSFKAGQKQQDIDLLDSLSDGIAKTDAEGKILFINAAMIALMGIDPNAMDDDKFLKDFVGFDQEDPDNAEKIEQLFDPTAANRPAVIELSRQFESGERVLRIARQPIRNSRPHSRLSDQAGQAWSVRDITQRRLADQARDDFLDSATHELRTPLANIKAYAETLEYSSMIDVEQQKEFCNIINSEATRLARFIDELLDVSSIEAGSLAVNRQKVELKRLMDDALQKVQPLFKQKNIEFVHKFDDKLPELSLDKDKFVTCLINLLGNAAKYTPEDGEVNFRAKVVNNQLVIEVEDSGIGISEEELPHVFEKFYRSADSRVHNESGTGLGLAFAHEVVNLHGGSLTATSKLNEGSTFTISIPVS